MNNTYFDSVDLEKKLIQYFTKAVDSKEALDGYQLSIFSHLIDAIRDYNSNNNLDILTETLLSKFPESDLPETNKRQIIKSRLSEIEDIEPFKLFLSEINF